MINGRVARRRGSDRSGGTGAVHHLATTWDSQVGPVPPPDVAEAGHTAGCRPSSGVPWGRRAPC